MKKSFTLFAMLLFFTTFNQILAQDADPKSEFSFSGSVDVYFRTNLNAKNSGEEYQAPGTSFGNLPGFSLGMVNLIGSYEGEKGGFVADLVFGPRGEDAVFASPYYNSERGSSQIINQLYAYWNVSKSVTLTLGNFNTFLGYEVISPAANFHYTTSYMFSYGPFSHTGLKANLALSDNISVMASVMNPTDLTEFNPFGTYTMGLQVGLFGKTFFNFLYGDQDGKIKDNQPVGGINEFSAGKTFQADLTTGFDLSDAFYLGVNATYNTTGVGEVYNGADVQEAEGDGAGFYGAAGYFQLKASDAIAVGTRVEYFKVYNNGLEVVGLDAEGDGSVVNVTLSANAKVGGLTIIPELRLDATSEDSFLDGDLEASDKLMSFLVAAVYTF